MFRKYMVILVSISILFGLYLANLYNYLLFHSLAEIFSIVVACGIFIVAWNSRRFLDNNFLLFIGIAYLFIAVLDLIHTFAYKGMNIFRGYETNLPTQLWIAARSLQSLSLFIATFFFRRKVKIHFVFLGYLLATSFLLMSIFYWESFPVCFIEGKGLTPFKKVSEYIISLVLLGSIALLSKNRSEFDKEVFQWVVWSIILTIASELAFTFYIHAYGFSNLVGHFFKIVAFYLIYKALIETGLRRPYGLLFRGLKESKDALEKSRNELEIRVKERTAELSEANETLRTEIIERKRAEEEVRLLQTITFAIGEAGDVHSALKIVLQKVCEATGWVIGEAWVPNSDGTYLECSPAWYSRVEGLEKFRKECEKMTFPLGIGLPGMVWSSKKPAWIKDVALDPNFIRVAIAREVGLKTAMAIPVLVGDEIIAVMDFFVFEARKEDEHLLEIVSSVAAQLGSLIQRKRAEVEKRVLEDQLRQAQKVEAIGRLAGGIAHDFNNLLTIIKGNSQLSLMELKAGDPLRENIEEVEKAADRAAALTRQLLAFSRRQVLEMRVLDLNTILRDLEKMLRRVIGEDIGLVTLLAENLGTVKADPGQIEQVVMNLAVNARDAMLKGGKLTIETTNVELDENYARNHVAVPPGSYVMLSVSDTGVGMTPEVRERIFEPFFTTKEKGKGTGLGLSTVYGIVKQSGGNIWVYSEVGQGTAFKIYLPRVDEPLEEAGERVVQKELPGGSETILVVEDEEKVRQLTVQILTKNGYAVLEASHGDEAKQICEQHGGPIHLIVTDVVLPGMNGRELAESLASRYPGAKVLYMSGYTDDAIVHHGVLEKGLSFLQKPFNLEDLLRKVREVLDKT